MKFVQSDGSIAWRTRCRRCKSDVVHHAPRPKSCVNCRKIRVDNVGRSLTTPLRDLLNELTPEEFIEFREGMRIK